MRFRLTISRLNFVSGATVFEIKGASIRRLCQWLSGMINILSLNELSPVLMRFSSPRYQRLGSQAEELARQSTQPTPWHEKLNEKGERYTRYVERDNHVNKSRLSFVEHVRVPCHSHLVQLAH